MLYIMDHIYDANDKFQFDNLVLNKPVSISGGNFFIKYSINQSPLYIQPPKCSTRQNTIKGTKRLHCDFVFSQENEEFIQWMENLENHTQQIIYKNRQQWFETELELHDIENSFTSPMKSFKSGKFYIVRTNIPNRLGKSVLKIYDEDQHEISFENIKDNMSVMCILEIQGVRCSARSFQIDIELKQMMVMQPLNLFDKCIFTPLKNSNRSVDISSTKLPVADLNIAHQNDDNSNLHGYKIRTHIPILEQEQEQEQEQEEELPESTQSSEYIIKTNTTQFDKEDKDILEEESCITEKIEIKKEEELCEVEFNLEELADSETVKIKQRNDVYYEMYREARRKAKIARNLALSSYLEAKRIKNTYMLDDILDSDEEDDPDNEYNDQEDNTTNSDN